MQGSLSVLGDPRARKELETGPITDSVIEGEKSDVDSRQLGLSEKPTLRSVARGQGDRFLRSKQRVPGGSLAKDLLSKRRERFGALVGKSGGVMT